MMRIIVGLIFGKSLNFLSKDLLVGSFFMQQKKLPSGGALMKIWNNGYQECWQYIPLPCCLAFSWTLGFALFGGRMVMVVS